MEGVFFYWLMWMAWVVLLFFIPQTVQKRTSLIFHIQSVIFLSGWSIPVLHVSCKLSGIYLIVIICYYIRVYSPFKLFLFLIHSFIIMMAYCCFMIFSILDPVWLIMDASLLLAAGMNYLAWLIQPAWKDRFLVICLGLALGDFLFAEMLSYQGIQYEGMSYTWLDQSVGIIGGTLVLWGMAVIGRKAISFIQPKWERFVPLQK
ncbi:YphA family membrane protein [Bacillus massiliglaciei]